MTTITVDTTTGLLEALKAATDGDVIQLAAGSYEKFMIRNINIDGNVTIISADPENQAELNGMVVKYSSGLTFADLDFHEVVPGQHKGFQVYGSHDIAFDNVKVHGPDNLGSGMETSLMMIRESHNVSVSNSEFYNAWHGLSMLNNQNVQITDNSFHDIRTDGVRGGGNSDLLISRNMFTDFYPAEYDHPDAIQLWTTNTTEVARDITISENLVVRGDGAPIQGVFVRDTFSSLPFENLTITDNLVVGGLYNGVAVNGVTSGSITNNIVAGFEDQKSWLRADNADDVVIDGNRATEYVLNEGEATQIGENIKTHSIIDDGAAVVQGWLAKHEGFAYNWAPEAGSVMKLLGLELSELSLITEEQRLTLVEGTDGKDRLSAVEFGNSRVEAGAGNDALTGATEGRNELAGGTGNDVYILRSDGDIVIEEQGEGTDTVRTDGDYTLTANVENMRMDEGARRGTGNEENNRIIGNNGDNILEGLDGRDILQGGNGNDILSGGADRDVLRGDNGNDRLIGGGGRDTLVGGKGYDILEGGSGNDVLEGGAGWDLITGGEGKDLFRIRPDDVEIYSEDTITDFEAGVDRIAVNMIDANSNTSKNDVFTFIGDEDFHKVAGELRYEVVGGDTHIYGDMNGDGVGDFGIILKNMTNISENDFML